MVNQVFVSNVTNDKTSAFCWYLSHIYVISELSPVLTRDQFQRDSYARLSFSERKQGGSLDAKQVSESRVVCHPRRKKWILRFLPCQSFMIFVSLLDTTAHRLVHGSLAWRSGCIGLSIHPKCQASKRDRLVLKHSCLYSDSPSWICMGALGILEMLCLW